MGGREVWVLVVAGPGHRQRATRVVAAVPQFHKLSANQSLCTINRKRPKSKLKNVEKLQSQIRARSVSLLALLRKSPSCLSSTVLKEPTNRNKIRIHLLPPKLRGSAVASRPRNTEINLGDTFACDRLRSNLVSDIPQSNMRVTMQRPRIFSFKDSFSGLRQVSQESGCRNTSSLAGLRHNSRNRLFLFDSWRRTL